MARGVGMKLTLDTLHMYADECGGCLLWKQGVNSQGYPQAHLDGKPGQMVRRYVFLCLMGRTLRKGERVAVRCGTKLCISPVCMFQETYSRSLARSYEAGKRHTVVEYGKRFLDAQARLAKLDWEQVDALRALPADVSHAAAARMFCIHPKTASKVRRGITWRDAARSSSVFSWTPQ